MAARNKSKKAMQKEQGSPKGAALGILLLFGGMIILYILFTKTDKIKENFPLLAIVGAIGIGIIVFAFYLDYKIEKKRLFNVNSAIRKGVYIAMSGEDYEKYVADRLKICGYRNIRTTKASGDHGADIIADSPDGVKCAIQCKYYSKPVGNKAVQEALAGKVFYGCEKAMVITNNTYTKQAVEDAKRMGVELLSRF